ncbi:hypothetical protein CIW54_23760 [Paraburkholderia sp. T12-10]|nr:hypothetical protein CIW54_23760 [Paraburkholderia sp. T12-10]
MPIDRLILPNTTAPLDSPSASATPANTGVAAGLPGSGRLSPSGPLAFLPTSPFQARHVPRGRHASPPQVGGNDAIAIPADQPIVRGPRFQRTLTRMVEEMSLDDSSSSASDSSIDDDAQSQSSDDFFVKADSSAGHPDFWSGGARRAARREALQEWVDLSSIPADAHALAAGADELRNQAENAHPISGVTDFGDLFQGFDVDGWRRETLFKCDDAGRAWQIAADQYHAARDAARKVGLPPGEIERLDDAAAHCYAQTQRHAVKASLFAAIIAFKCDRHSVGRGDLRVLQAVLGPLRTALEHCESDALRALPLDSAPIEGFDPELRAISDALDRLSAADANQTRPSPWADHRDAAVSSLGYVLSALPLVLRGEPNLPAMLGTLRSALATPMAHAREVLAGAETRQSDPSDALDHLTGRFESWYEAARAYDDALRVFGDSTASWPDSARSAPEPQQLRAELVESRDSALHRAREALIGLFSTMATLTHGPQATDPEPTAGIGTLTTAERLMNADLLSRCQTLRAKLQSAFAQDAGDFDAARLALPFAALEQYVQAVLGRDANLLDAANDVRKAAQAADNAAPTAGRAWGPTLRQFSAGCARQRSRLLNSAFQIAHADSVNCSLEASTAMGPALECVYGLRQALPVVWFDPSPEERDAAHEAETAERALIASSREAVQAVQAHIARMPSPPADANSAIIENHANLQLNLNAIATAQRTVAELIECCSQARRTIHEGPTAGCAANLRRLAVQVQRAGDQATDVLALGRNRRLTQGIAAERAQRTLQFIRRVARTARCIHYTLGVLADISDGYQQAQNLSREPILDPLRFQQAADRQTRVVDRAAKDIDATRKQLIASVGTQHPSEHAAMIAAQDIEEIQSFTLGLEWRYVADFDSAKRQWLRATVRALAARLAGPPDAAPPAADAMLDLIEQHLAAGTKILISASRVDRSERITNAIRENNEIRRETQDCREQLKRLPVRTRVAVGAGPSRPEKRNDKKASGKAKRR